VPELPHRSDLHGPGCLCGAGVELRGERSDLAEHFRWLVSRLEDGRCLRASVKLERGARFTAVVSERDGAGVLAPAPVYPEAPDA
jgi:hypothetical protein